MPHELYIDALQHAPGADGLSRRRLTPDEVHAQALDRRPGWIAWHLGRVGDEALVEAALAADPQLAADLKLRMLDDDRIGIVVDDVLATRITAAIGA